MYLAQRKCLQNLKKLDSVGDCPVHLVQNIINKVEDPEQLRRLEVNSPQLVGHTKEAWTNMLQRDVPQVEDRVGDKNWRNTFFAMDKAGRWWKVYQKIKQDFDKEKDEKAAKLAAQLNGIKKQQQDQLSQVTERRAPVKTNRWQVAAVANARSTGRGFFDKMHRNAVTKSIRTGTATHKLKPLNERVPTRAPIALVEDLRYEKEQKAKAKLAKEQIEKARNEAKTSTSPQQSSSVDHITDREARLRRLKDGKARDEVAKEALIKFTTDFLEDSDEDDKVQLDDDELFGTVPHSQAIVNKAVPARSSPSRPIVMMSSPHKPVMKRRREAPSLFTKSGRGR